MTTPSHGIQSAVIQWFVYPKWYFILMAVVLGTFADLIRLFQKDKNDWTNYKLAHELSWYNLLLPYHNLHIVEDYFIHNHEIGGWNWYGIYVEILIDVILIIVGLKCINIF